MIPKTNRNYTYFVLTQSWVYFLIGLVILFWLHTIGLEQKLLEQTPLAIEMDGSATNQNIETVVSILESHPSVLRNTIHVISREEALKLMTQTNPGDSSLLHDENPFNPIVLFQLQKTSLHKSGLEELKTKLLKEAGVHQFAFQNELLNDISNTIRKIQSVCLGLAILFVGMAIMIGKYMAGVFVDTKYGIIQTYSRLGASLNQVKRPYLKQSAILGLASAGFSIVLIGIIWISITYLVPWLHNWLQINYFALVVIFLLIFGPLIQIFFVNMTINRWLDESNPTDN